ncbi:hypothetical protein A0H81_02766 [Grifola frondosa]|uniref:Uncharacterized protein n=1 Tax=Grifola frondosa TaxID=5627 RepID=A0A1C7MKL5_GRIFR|nr:hypothetical protein A0H81_02766 [Grifola frondosa]
MRRYVKSSNCGNIDPSPTLLGLGYAHHGQHAKLILDNCEHPLRSLRVATVRVPARFSIQGRAIYAVFLQVAKGSPQYCSTVLILGYDPSRSKDESEGCSRGRGKQHLVEATRTFWLHFLRTSPHVLLQVLETAGSHNGIDDIKQRKETNETFCKCTTKSSHLIQNIMLLSFKRRLSAICLVVWRFTPHGLH